MHRMRLALPLVLALAPIAALADPTAAELSAASEAEARGAEIYAYDQAAWHSTDQLLVDLKKRKSSMEQVSREGMAGYVVEPAGTGLLLATYYGVKDGKTVAMARYWVRGSKVERGGFLKQGDDPALSPMALLLVETRRKTIDAAIADKVFICTKGQPNTVVLPPRADGSIPAYLLSASVQTGRFPAGGHYRYVFGGDGTLLSSRAFTKACVDVDTAGLPKKAEGFGVSHMLDPQPTEIHVFVSYNVPVKLFVITDANRSLWLVDSGKVSFKQVMKDLPSD